MFILKSFLKMWYKAKKFLKVFLIVVQYHSFISLAVTTVFFRAHVLSTLSLSHTVCSNHISSSPVLFFLFLSSHFEEKRISLKIVQVGVIYSDLDFDTDTVKAEDQGIDHWTGAYRIMRCIRLKKRCPRLSTVLLM